MFFFPFAPLLAARGSPAPPSVLPTRVCVRRFAFCALTFDSLCLLSDLRRRGFGCFDLAPPFLLHCLYASWYSSVYLFLFYNGMNRVNNFVVRSRSSLGLAYALNRSSVFLCSTCFFSHDSQSHINPRTCTCMCFSFRVFFFITLPSTYVLSWCFFFLTFPSTFVRTCRVLACRWRASCLAPRER